LDKNGKMAREKQVAVQGKGMRNVWAAQRPKGARAGARSQRSNGLSFERVVTRLEEKGEKDEGDSGALEATELVRMLKHEVKYLKERTLPRKRKSERVASVMSKLGK
jgi:hypothetical protein